MHAARRFAAVAAILGASAAHAESTYEFWPEMDAYLTLDSRTRVFLLATMTRVDQEGRPGITFDPATDSTLGVHIDYSLTPTLRAGLLEQDWERNRYLWVRAGYQHARSLGNGDAASEFRENRGVFEISGRTARTAGGVALFSRLRWDLRDRGGERSSLYRVRLGIERPFDLLGRAAVPYANAEAIYDTRYSEWKQQRYQFGMELSLTEKWRMEPYLEIRDDRRAEPSRVYALGLTFKYFR